MRTPRDVRTFLNRLKRRFRLQQVYLFGSRAKGTPREDSDWDFIIVSTSFGRLNSYHRAVEVYKLANGSFAVDVLCYTPEEFAQRRAGPTIVRQAIDEHALVEVEV